ncbi:MAG TPA: ABC transporter ATP-binding protein [Acidimicrobiales bacterium]|nr:ABC transporter ATP-binding protein [Acidimicrobiales bacterium]
MPEPTDAALARPRPVDDRAPAVSAGAPSDLLVLDRVVAGYGGGDVLRGVSFAVPEGGITCLIGPNGAGKSTVLTTINGLLKPRRGEIRLRSESIGGMSPRAVLARSVVTVPQAHSLFNDMTVRENVELGACTLNDREVVARRLDEVHELFPLVAQRAKVRAGRLSGGQQRLIEFARALMLDPELVLLDEPSMGLDPKAMAAVFETIIEMNRRGKTILLVEQNAKAALRISSQGVVLESGTVRLTGSGPEVLEDPEIGRLYLGGAVRRSV